MSRLSEIIDAASANDVTTPNLLRKLKVVAARLETPPLLDWVDAELSGYAPAAQLPAYRGPFSVEVISDWSGPFRSFINNLPLPSVVVPKGLREAGFSIDFRESVGELERFAQSDDSVVYSWGADVVAILNSQMESGAIPEIVEMHSLVSARRKVPVARIESVLDNVRTRVLNLALELEQIQPDAGEPGAKAVDPLAVNYVVTNNIYGHGNAVAVDSPGARQKASSVIKGDLRSLLDAVSAAGLQQDLVDELESAVLADEAVAEQASELPGSRVRDFLGKLVLITTVGVGQVATGAMGNVVAELVQAYYGI